MKYLLIIPFLFCVQDTVKVQKPIKMFFDNRSTEQMALDINTKLDSLILFLQKDTTNGKYRNKRSFE